MAIDLDAPQYPEGLNLKIFADKLGGDVEIIKWIKSLHRNENLHAEDFMEFSVLTYIIFLCSICINLRTLGKKKVLYTLYLFICFILE